jgi:hypothetical protein
VRSIQKWFVEFGVEELDWLAQSPDLNPIKHIFLMNRTADCEPGLGGTNSILIPMILE